MPSLAAGLVPVRMSPGACAGDHGRGPPRRSHRVEQRPGQVFLRAQRPGHRPSRVADAGRVGAEEDRGGGDLIARHGHRDGHVVPLEPPRPRRLARGVAEDADPVVVAVPAPPPLLFPVKHLLQRDDAHRLGVGVLAQPGGQQPVRGLARGLVQLGQAHAGAPPRPVLQPPPRRVVGERPGRQRPLLVAERRQQGQRGRSHLLGYAVGTHPPGIAAVRRGPGVGRWRARVPHTCTGMSGRAVR